MLPPPSAPLTPVPADVTATTAIPEAIEDIERQHILATLSAAGGVRRVAAERLGISERTLRNKLKAVSGG